MATETSDAGKTLVPAYVAFPTFLNFVDGYAGDSVLPDHIDKSLMPTMSGGTQNHLMAALKALSLIDDKGTTTAEFKLLVKARPDADKWRRALKGLIDVAYKSVADSDNLSKLTPKKLQDSFRAAGATGSTNGRAIRFYLSAMKECGIEVPKHLSKASSGGASTPRKKPEGAPTTTIRDKPKNEAEVPDDDKNQSDPDGFTSFPVFLGQNRKGRIVFPTDLKEADCNKYEAAVKYLRELAKPE